jgi:hypothetical protein
MILRGNRQGPHHPGWSGHVKSAEFLDYGMELYLRVKAMWPDVQDGEWDLMGELAKVEAAADQKAAWARMTRRDRLVRDRN